MGQRRIATSAIAVTAPALCAGIAAAEMGPCVPADFDLMCGSGDGAARVIVKTISPSRRLGFAWRLTNRPPNKPEQNDPNLENLIVRIVDGAALAKSHGSYWDLGTKIAKAYLMTAWSPDSRLLVKVEQRAEYASAELFAFEDDAAIGPVDLVKAIESAIRDKIDAREAANSTLVFAAHPAMTINDQGLLHAVVHTRGEDATDGPRYDVTVQVTRAVDSLDARVVSVTPRAGTSISIIVH